MRDDRADAETTETMAAVGGGGSEYSGDGVVFAPAAGGGGDRVCGGHDGADFGGKFLARAAVTAE